IDGNPLGSQITAAPYSRTWDTTTVSNGPHTVTAVATDTSGNTASASVSVTVSQKPDSPPPTVTLTGPVNHHSLPGPNNLTATASDNVAVANVQFSVDGKGVSGPITSGPYQAVWDSSKVADGNHTITATATDTSGNTATSSITVRIVNGGVFGPVVN